MDRIQALLDVIGKVRAFADSLQVLADSFSPAPTVVPRDKADASSDKKDTVPAQKEKTVKLEEVRTLLGSLSRDGHLEEVRDLIHKYGGQKLSEIDPENYAALFKDAEDLQNAAG